MSSLEGGSLAVRNLLTKIFSTESLINCVFFLVLVFFFVVRVGGGQESIFLRSCFHLLDFRKFCHKFECKSECD